MTGKQQHRTKNREKRARECMVHERGLLEREGGDSASGAVFEFEPDLWSGGSCDHRTSPARAPLSHRPCLSRCCQSVSWPATVLHQAQAHAGAAPFAAFHQRHCRPLRRRRREGRRREGIKTQRVSGGALLFLVNAECRVQAAIQRTDAEVKR